MLRLEWNALRDGDRVLIHDDASSRHPLRTGAVALVQSTHGSINSVAVRLDDDGSTVRPRRHAVHSSPLDRSATCWRCVIADAAISPTGSRDEP